LKKGRKKLLVALLSLAVMACFGSGSVFAAGDSGNTYKIDYNQQTDIHSVKMEDGSEVIIFCMNNKRHWPHTTPTITSVPLYEQTSIEEFCKENGITDPDKVAEFTDRLKTILYAGYPYNGMSLYGTKSNVDIITEDQFNQILNPPEALRKDFPDTLDGRIFYLDDLKNNTGNIDYLKDFSQQVYELYPTGGTTKSGLSYDDITSTPFYGAVWSMINSSTPLESYSQVYGGNYFITDAQAYSATSNAVWNLMKEYGIPDNTGVLDSTPLSKSLKVAQSTDILTEKPDSSYVSIEGDALFEQNSADGKWYTGPLTLKAPSTYSTTFKLTLPQGVTTTDGKTEVKVGDTFTLVSDTEPQGGANISLTSTIPWMEGDLIVFQAVNDANHEFQNMIGAKIHRESITVNKLMSVAEKTTRVSITKTWNDEDNKDGKRPSSDEFAKSIHLMNGDTEVIGVTPTITDNLDNTYTVVYEDLPLVDKNGNEIQYTVKEDEVTGYDADKSSVENGGTITNTQEKEEPKDPAGPTDPEDPSNPGDPGDNVDPTDPQDPGKTTDPKNPSDNTDKTTTDNGNNSNKTTVVKKVSSIVQTGDNGTVILYGFALVCAAVLVVLLVQIRKGKNSHVR
jgi:hypothetical protein